MSEERSAEQKAKNAADHYSAMDLAFEQDWKRNYGRYTDEQIYELRCLREASWILKDKLHNPDRPLR